MKSDKVKILFQDDNMLVLNKPSGVSVTKDRSGDPELKDLLTGQFGGESTNKLRLVHRLDKEASGVMLLAFNKQTQSELSGLFAKRQVNKTYLAIVRGCVTKKNGRISIPVAPKSGTANLMRTNRKRGKKATTYWQLLADFGSAALLKVQPVTGRKHQIRLHLASAGMPLAFDPSYGGTRPLLLSDFKNDYRLGKAQEEKPLLKRLPLHAYQIEFENPLREVPNCFIAGLDGKFKAALKMLTKHNPKGKDAFTTPTTFDAIINDEKLS